MSRNVIPWSLLGYKLSIMKKIFFISFLFGAVLTSCTEEQIIPNDPCTDWWQGVTLTSGAVFSDTDNDGTLDILHFTDANGNTTTYTCIDDLNGDCIHDCFEQFIL